MAARKSDFKVVRIRKEIERRIAFEQKNIDDFIAGGCNGEHPVTSEVVRLTLQGLLMFVKEIENED